MRKLELLIDALEQDGHPNIRAKLKEMGGDHQQSVHPQRNTNTRRTKDGEANNRRVQTTYPKRLGECNHDPRDERQHNQLLPQPIIRVHRTLQPIHSTQPSRHTRPRDPPKDNQSRRLPETIRKERRSALKLLFVCTANIDRGPTAEDIYKNQPGFEAKSAGTEDRLRGNPANQGADRLVRRNILHGTKTSEKSAQT